MWSRMLCSTNTSLMSHLAQGLHEIPCFPITPQTLQRVSDSSLTSPPPICAFPPSEAQALSPAQSWTLQAQQRWQNKSLCNGQWCHCQHWDDKMQFSYTHEILGNALKRIKNWHNLEKIYMDHNTRYFANCSRDVQNSSYWFRTLKMQCLIPSAIISCFILCMALYSELLLVGFFSCHGVPQIFGVNSVFFTGYVTKNTVCGNASCYLFCFTVMLKTSLATLLESKNDLNVTEISEWSHELLNRLFYRKYIFRI